MRGHALADELLIGKDGGHLRLFKKMPQAEDRDATFPSAETEFQIKTAGNDSVSMPASEAAWVVVNLPTLLREDAPRSVQREVAPDAQKDFAARPLRRLGDQRDMRRTIWSGPGFFHETGRPHKTASSFSTATVIARSMLSRVNPPRCAVAMTRGCRTSR